MMKKILVFLTFCCFFYSLAQNNVYRPERAKTNNLVHTRLKVDFNFNNKQLRGEAWITLKPHYYPTNTLTLDAKAFDIHEIKIEKNDLSYQYDKRQIVIELGKTYKKNEEYTVYIKYTANPEKVTQKGGRAIFDAKGLYFVNATDAAAKKPTQVWTQGETESSSCWFPTIDTPNQKTSQEIYVTVPDELVTLSNGDLIDQERNIDGTRTDYWKMDEKHAPYLFFLGVGDFSIVNDTWRDLKVDYYVDPEYKYVADQIFGNTPEMISFFSDLTGIEYPWDKYSQIVVSDFVSGAMENTTAVVHSDSAYQHLGNLVDDNKWEGTIAHELFHHWFGNYVTTESWSNLTVNESFATYAAYLWFEYKYGKDKADAEMEKDVQGYLKGENSEKKDLVRFYYEDKEDMFDVVSYNKGSAILHMLRYYLGDNAFFDGMNLFLKKHKFGTAEAHDIRLAYEEVCGEDLNWFFNQWFFGNGHIKIDVSYDYNQVNKTVSINIKQTEKIFVFPLSIDIYEVKGGVTRHDVWVDDIENTFILPYQKEPKLVNVGAKRILLAEINDQKSLDQLIYQYNYAPNYLDRKLAIEEISTKQQENRQAYKTLLKALDDSYDGIRIFALTQLDIFPKNKKKDAINKVLKIAKSDEKTLVKAEAIKVLGKLVDKKYKSLFIKGLESESYAILGASLQSLYQLEPTLALDKIASFDEITKMSLANEISNIYILEKDQTQLKFIASKVLSGMFLTSDKNTQEMYGNALAWISKSDDLEAIQILTDDFVKLGLRYQKYQFDEVAIKMMNQILEIQKNARHINQNQIQSILRAGIAKLMKYKQN